MLKLIFFVLVGYLFFYNLVDYKRVSGVMSISINESKVIKQATETYQDFFDRNKEDK